MANNWLLKHLSQLRYSDCDYWANAGVFWNHWQNLFGLEILLNFESAPFLPILKHCYFPVQNWFKKSSKQHFILTTLINTFDKFTHLAPIFSLWVPFRQHNCTTSVIFGRYLWLPSENSVAKFWAIENHQNVKNSYSKFVKNLAYFPIYVFRKWLIYWEFP